MKQLGFYTQASEKFPKIKISYEKPSLITNVIIEYFPTLDLKKLSENLDNLGCEAIQFRFINQNNIETAIKETAKKFKQSIISYIEFYIDTDISIENIKNVMKENNRIRNVYLFNQSENSIRKIEEKQLLIV